jgi:hypothetical protein
MTHKKKTTINFNLHKKRDEIVYKKLNEFTTNEGHSDSQGVIEYIWFLTNNIKRLEEEVAKHQQARSYLESFKEQFISQNKINVRTIKTLEDTKDGIKELSDTISDLKAWNSSN